MILYCVRHGESQYNATGRIQGQLDIPLSELGQRQGDAAAEALKDRQIEAIFSSPLQRALHTAHRIGKALNLEVQVDDRLMEINAGVFQGLNWEEIETSHPVDSLLWKTHDPDFIIPQGESRRQLMQRGREVLEEIATGSHKRVAVVAHGGLLTAAMKALLDIPAARNPFSLLNCSISQISIEPETSAPPSSRVRLMSLNESAHLAVVNNGKPIHSGDL